MSKFKRCIAFILSFILIFTLIPKEVFEVFAAPVNITITNFDYIQTNNSGNTSVRVVIKGTNFLQMLSGTKEESVIKDILVKSGAEPKSLMQGDAVTQGVKVNVTDSLITIVAPKDGDFATLNINTNAKNTITINTKSLPTNSYDFDVQINNLPSMSGSLDNKRNYVGQKLTIKGANFNGVSDTVIAGASHQVATGEMQVDASGNTITIPKLIKGTLNKDEKIQFIKVDTTSNTTGTIRPAIQFTAEYLNKILVFEKLVGMDNLEVLPSEGPHSTPSKITVRARDMSGNLLKRIFNSNNELYLRREVNGKEENLKLTDVKLVYEDPDNTSSDVVAIEGWTPTGTRPAPSVWDLVVKDKGNVSSEGVKQRAFTFSTSNPAPQITGISPAEGPDTGGTDVLITGKNLINVNTPGIKIPNNFRLLPSGNATVEDNDTLVVEYSVPGGTNLKYGDKVVSGVKRKIKVRIASMTNANSGQIFTPTQTPGPGVTQGGIEYGKYHFLAGNGTDGLVVTTTNASTGGPQDVILEMDTIFTFNDSSEITIPEAAKYKSFTYNEKNPTPVVDKVELEYGYFNDSAEEGEPPVGGTDGVKPLMLRITGDKLEAYKGADGKMKFPTVQFVLPDNTVLPVVSSTADDDTKVLDEKGNPIDGIYNKVGKTLVVSIIPPTNGKYDLRQLIGSSQEQPGGYKNLEGIIQVTNPSGNHNTTNATGSKFQFRRPVETSYTDVNSKQPVITQITSNGAPLKKLPSDAETTIEIRVKAVAGISDAKKLIVTVDGLDISKNIKSTKLDGEETVISLTVPKGFVGKSRLQVIIPEGLMDSYQIIFDNVRGPEIKELIPEEGDKGTIVVIKRDDQANEVSFKPPVETSSNEAERIGSKVLWNGIDINEIFNGYTKDGAGKVVYQQSDTFKNFKQSDKDVPAELVNLPGKYVYVVDANTIYLKIPQDDALKEGEYNIQIKNPDGSESSIAKVFKIVDTIDKTKIGTISPNVDDIKGGIITTITAGIKDGIQTNFKGGVDVYIGSQKAEVIGYDIDNKEVYVKVPPLKDFEFPKSLSDKVGSYTVPVTIQNKVNKSTDTINDGFIYLNPNYKVEITQVYNEKYSTDPKNANANKGVEGEFIIIRGSNFRLETDANGNFVLPKVMFGYKLSETPVAFGAKNLKPDGSPQTDSQGRAELEWIKVKVPKQPTIGINADGSVNLLVQNPDGAKAIKEKGFIYNKNNPSINEKASILQASRFHDTITVVAKEINKDGLVIAFGNKKYEKELSSTEMQIETTKEVEKIVVKYIPNTSQNIEIYYKKPDGTLVLMTDTQGTTGGKARLGAIGDKIIVGLNWKNPAYHSTEITKNPELISQLNTEYMEIYAENKAPNINTLIVRRGLGKLVDFKQDSTSGDAQLTIETPYNDKSEKTTITLINSDGSSATAPFIFHGGLNGPEITDIDGSKDRDITIEGKTVKAKVYTSDYTSDTEITVIGKNFKDIEKVLVGDKEAEVISVSSDYTKLKIKVPKGNKDDVGKPLPITVVTKEGTGYSDKANPPAYFMYIQAGSKPVIESVTPKKGPQTGGTKVTITGTNFKDIDEFGTKGDIEVFFAGVKGKVSKILKNEKGEIVGLEAITPAVDMIDDKSTVVVKNADEGKSEGSEFKYISQPIIEKMEGNFKFFAEKGEEDDDVKVTIIGKNFYNPSKVMIGSKTIKVDKNKDNKENELMLGVKSDGSNQYVELEKDKDGKVKGLEISVGKDNSNSSNNSNANANKNKNNTTSFTITVPQITFEQMESMVSKNIVVINEDGGISPEVPADIKLPVPQAPVVIATPGYGNTVGLSWDLKKDDRNKATRFEIYAKEYGSSNDYAHVGDLPANADTSDLKYTFTVKDLKPDTNYQFKVRVMNKFGEAEDFGYATVRTLKKEDDYKNKEKEKELERANTKVRQEGTKTVVGDTLKYTVGTKENVIDLSNYQNVAKKEIRIPASQIKLAPNANIQIVDKNMRLSLPFRAFSLNQVSSSSDNAVVVIKLQNNDNKLNTYVSKAIPKNKKRITQVHKIDFQLEEPKKTVPIKFTNAPLNMTLIPNKQVGASILAKYNEKSNSLEQYADSGVTQGGYYVLLGNK